MKTQERKRKLQRAKQLDNEPELSEISDETSSSCDETSSDTEYSPPFKKQWKEEEQKKKRATNTRKRKLPNLAKTCDITGVSDRAAALISSLVLEDYGIVSQGASIDIIGRSRVQ